MNPLISEKTLSELDDIWRNSQFFALSLHKHRLLFELIDVEIVLCINFPRFKPYFKICPFVRFIIRCLIIVACQSKKETLYSPSIMSKLKYPLFILFCIPISSPFGNVILDNLFIIILVIIYLFHIRLIIGMQCSFLRWKLNIIWFEQLPSHNFVKQYVIAIRFSRVNL